MRLTINVFRGIQNIPNFVAERQGFFAARGLDVDTVFTDSSEAQRRDLAAGACDLAHSAVDNALALIASDVDTLIVIGADRGFNKLVVRPGISSFEDMRGKTFGVDAPDTAFALLGYETLRRHGLERNVDYKVTKVGGTPFRLEALKEGRVDFALLNLPFNLLAEDCGLTILGDPLDVIGPYQGTGAFVLRDWAGRNGEALEAYLASYVEGLRWAQMPDHQDEVVSLLQERLDLLPEMATRCYKVAVDPSRGFFPDAAIDELGLAQVVRLREAFSLGAPRQHQGVGAFVDQTFYARALANVNGQSAGWHSR